MALVSPPIPLALDVFARSLAEIGRAGELDLANIAGIVGYGSPYAFAMRHLPWRRRIPAVDASEVSGRHCATEPLEAAGNPIDDETAVLIGRLLPRTTRVTYSVW